MSQFRPKLRSVLMLTAIISVGAAATACAPVVSRQGFQVQDSSPRDVKVGEDTKSSVLAKLGSPSAVSTFEPNIWYYISQTAETYTYHKPQVSARDVVVITFDKSNDQVAKVDTLALKDGKHLAYNRRETPTRGREMTALEQLLGNIGRTALPQSDQDTVPDQHPH
jgi:outer membrane protein assembly factor BamE (lipoprotein component of BamABCDE complex)